MTLQDCPRYESCSAPMCPLTAGGSYLDGEPLCFYVREHAKDNPPLDEDEIAIFKAIDSNQESMLLTGGTNYRKAVRRAAKHPSKRNAFKTNSCISFSE